MANTDPVVLVTAQKQLFGITDQATSPTLISVTTYERGASTVRSSGTANFNLQSLDLDQFKGSEMTMDGNGVPCQFAIFAEGIRCKVSYVPEGSTISDAQLAAAVPPAGSYMKIANAPIMAFGCFLASDHAAKGAFNTCNWLIEDAALRLRSGSRWEVEVTAACYKTTKMNNPFVTDV